MFSDYRWLLDHGVLPRDGGKLDQDPKFVEAVGIIAAEAAEIEKAKGSGRQGLRTTIRG